MKKIFLGLMAVVTVISMVSCGKKSVKEQLVGSWQNEDGDKIVTFYEDGRAVSNDVIFGIKAPTSWSYADGQLIIADGLQSRDREITVDGDTFTDEDDEVWYRVEE